MRSSRQPWATLVALAMVVTGHSAPSAQAPQSAVQRRAQIIPLVEHHQQLAGPTAITMQELDPPLPDVAVPPELGRVLRSREQLSGIEPPRDRLAQIYTDDVQLLDITDVPWLRWVRGLDAAAPIVAAGDSGSSFVPNHYWADGRSAFIAGVVRRNGSRAIASYFALGLRKSADDVWRIAAEQTVEQPTLPFAKPITADRIIQVLNDAGIQRGVVLSTAFWLGAGSVRGSIDEEYAKVRAENDWTVEQARQYSDRLVPFCSVNPLREYAVRELERCAALPGVKGMKLHFGNSRASVKNPEQLARLRQLFRAANAKRMAIVAHLWTRDAAYGAEHSRLFIDSILPVAPDITIQIAHLAGGGRFGSEPALAVFADAIKAHDPRMKRVYFDLATDVTDAQPPETLARIATRLREVGLDRILFGADTPITGRDPPALAWAMVRRLPLSDTELAIIANNVAPYLR